MGNTLAIVGNGFDIAHNLHTQYSEFINALSADIFAEFKAFVDKYCPESENWTAFEEQISSLSLRCFQKAYDNDCDYETVLNDIIEINRVFENIRLNLLDYLEKATTNTDVSHLQTISKVLSNSVHVLSFNYTSTAELYSDHVFYLHGSLEEKEIVLGYDFRDEPCLIDYSMMKWSKRLCRERLAYIRYVKTRLPLPIEELRLQPYVDDIYRMQEIKESGKGFDNEDLIYFNHPNMLMQFYNGNPYDYEDSIPNLNFEAIETLIILGHSLVADRKYLERIFERLVNLREIILFTYESEKKEELEEKKRFLTRYTSCITECFY